MAVSDTEAARTRSLDDRRLIDLDADGEVAAIEILDASAGVDLRNVPSRQEVEKLIGGLPFLVLV